MNGDTSTIYLTRGPVSGLISLADADATLRAEDEGASLGDVASAGDLDGDARADFLVGIWDDTTGGGRAGAAFLLRGPLDGERSLADSDAMYIGEAEMSDAGGSLAGAGDVDADDVPDLIIGADAFVVGDSSVGAAYIVLGGH
jgi:hypothetical protein